MSELTTEERIAEVAEMSDEDFLALQDSTETQEEPSIEAETDESESSSEKTVQSEEASETDLEAEETEQSEKSNEDTGSIAPDTLSDEQEDATESTTEAGKKDKTTDDVETKSEGTGESTDEQVVDYKSEYDKLMMPFKANGIDMQAKSVEDAIQLMKMGAGYHKSMAALKPAKRQMKLLEKNGLLDEDKLNYLIDLSNKDPKAIQKLLKDSNIDPLDIDVKADNDYKPTSRKITDTEIALDDVINDIRDTPTFNRTLNVVSKEWDESSQNTIATEPQIITTINGHIADGTYDAVIKRVDYERSLGRLNGVSDLQAYMTMGNAMADEGKLNRVGVPQTKSSPVITQSPKKEPSKKDQERMKKKKAASPTVTSKAVVNKPSLTPWDLSDEEFNKLDINKYANVT